MWNKRIKKQTEKTSSGVAVTLNELIDLRNHIIQKPIGPIHQPLKLPGQRRVWSRGRGMEFDTTREYQAGDDIRHMAWRVTARNLKPHIKTYREEKERPVWLAIDLSPSLYFGTRCMFKSVCSIKKITYLGWTYLLKREQIGAIIAMGQDTWIYKPQICERNFLTILNTLSQCSYKHPDFNETNYLSQLLTLVERQARSDHLIYIVSDFFQFDRENQKLILHLAQRTQVNLIFVYDTFEELAPPPHQYVLTNGQNKIAFNMSYEQNRLLYQQQFQYKKSTLIHFARKHNITLQILRTDDMQTE